MNPIALGFWEIVIVICLLWYALATVYIAVRGAADIQSMLSHLRECEEKEPPASD